MTPEVSDVRDQHERPSTVQVIWQMAMISLPLTRNELHVPRCMFDRLNKSEIEEIRTRLSNHLEQPLISILYDPGRQTFRFVTGINVPDQIAIPIAYASPPQSSPSPELLSEEHLPSWKVRAHGKKSEVPRPPNSFILYRQKWHPILKQGNPDMHNNDISVIIGKKWKHETQAVKDEFKALAEEKKRQHKQNYPVYQYMPRKPAEKKRRMTTRKRITIIDDENCESPQANDEFEFPTTSTYKPASPHNTEASLELPVSNSQLQWDLTAHNNQLTSDKTLPFLLPHRAEVTTSITPDIQDEQFLFDSLVNWDGVSEDMQIINTMIETERAELEAIVPGLNPAETKAQKLSEFMTEWERTQHFFE